MNREELFAYVRAHYDTEPDYPWEDNYAVLRHTNTRKWYGVIMEIPRNRLGMTGEAPVDILNVKCSPLLIGSLLGQPGYFPAYHMSKSSWISILLDGPEPDEELKQLLALSWDLTSPKRKRKAAVNDR